MFSLANVPNLFADKLAGLRRRRLTGPLVPARALDRSLFWHELHHLYVPESVIRRASPRPEREAPTETPNVRAVLKTRLTQVPRRAYAAAHWAAIGMELDDWSFLTKFRRKWQLDQKRGAVPPLAVATGMSAIETVENRLQHGSEYLIAFEIRLRSSSRATSRVSAISRRSIALFHDCAIPACRNRLEGFRGMCESQLGV
jgi:hypothetical protein